MFMHGFGFGVPWMGWVGLVLNLVIVAAIIVGIVLLIVSVVRRGNHPAVGQVMPAQPPAAPNPKDIAQTRYARGEITRDEYMQILADLGN